MMLIIDCRADLAFQAAFEIARIRLHARQPLDKQPQGDARQGRRQDRSTGRRTRSRPHGLPTDAGREPEPFGRMARDRGIENDHDGRHVAVLIALLVLGDLVGGAR